MLFQNRCALISTGSSSSPLLKKNPIVIPFIVRLLLGVFFIPVVIGYTQAFADQLMSIQRVHAPELAFLLGVTSYLAFHTLILVPSKAYVFGHELMHAAAAWISGGQVKGFKVGSKSGSVKTNKITSFIALAPYLVPVYAILWTFFYGLAGIFWNMRSWSWWFFFGLGASLTFHLVFTVVALKKKQTDLDLTGPVLALGLITWTNMTVVAGVMSLIVPEVHFVPYLTGGFEQTLSIYQSLFRQLFGV